MTAITTNIAGAIDNHPRVVAGILGGMILFFLAACLLHDAIPVCHWIFRCDHRYH